MNFIRVPTLCILCGLKMKFSIFTLIILIAIKLSLCDHLMLGDIENNRKLLYHHKAEYSSIPLIKRVKQFFYSDPNQRIIKGIVAYDNFNSKATITLTAGGIGHTFVNLRMTSKRGDGLSYDIGIYGVNSDSPIHLRYGIPVVYERNAPIPILQDNRSINNFNKTD